MGTERQGLGDLIGGHLIGADPTDIDQVQGLLKQAGYLGGGTSGSSPRAGTS